MKKIFYTMAVAAALFAGYSAYNAQNSNELTDVAFANVEALADNQEVSNMIFKWSDYIDCDGLFTGDYQVCEANGAKNVCNSPGWKTCDCNVNCN